MPVVTVQTNASAAPDVKAKFAKAVSGMFEEITRTPAAHTHVVVQDGVFVAWGGDPSHRAAVITIQASSSQILEENRKLTIDKLAPLLQEAFGINPDNTTTFFIDHPVEHIAVGTKIIQFSSPRAAQSHNPHF